MRILKLSTFLFSCSSSLADTKVYSEKHYSWAEEDRDFEPPEGYERQQFAYTDPDAYNGHYKHTRKRCKWSEPVNIFDHCSRYMRSQEHKHGIFSKEKIPWNIPVSTLGDPMKKIVSTCIDSTTDEEGNIVETYFTKLGPLELHDGDSQNFFMIPAGPIDSGKTSYLVETVDAYYDENEKPLTFPPVHPHHSALFMTGFDHENTYYGQGTMHGFTPFTALSDDAWVEGMYVRQQFPGIFQTSSNVPGFNVDLYGCRKGIEDPASACFYMTFPEKRGTPLYPGHDFWQNTMVVHTPPGPNQHIFIEYGRKFITPKNSSSITPVWSLDFSSVGNGDLYAVHGNGTSWQTYTMPVGGRFLGSWFHSHGVSEAEMWVLDKTADEILPYRLLDHCQKTANCGRVGTSRGTRRHDVALPPLGMDLDGLRSHVQSKFGGSVKCRFKSRTTVVGEHMLGRGSLFDKSTAETCSGWSFRAGQAVTLLIFTEPLNPHVTAVPDEYRKQRAVPQHHRWWPLAELDLPEDQYSKESFPPARKQQSARFDNLKANSKCTEPVHRKHGATCAQCLKDKKGGSCDRCIIAGFDCRCSCNRPSFDL